MTRLLCVAVLFLSACGLDLKIPPVTACLEKGELICQQAAVYECNGLVWKHRADCEALPCHYETHVDGGVWGDCSAENPGGTQ